MVSKLGCISLLDAMGLHLLGSKSNASISPMLFPLWPSDQSVVQAIILGQPLVYLAIKQAHDIKQSH